MRSSVPSTTPPAPAPSGEWEWDDPTLFDILERDGRTALLTALIDAGTAWNSPDFRKGVGFYRRGE